MNVDHFHLSCSSQESVLFLTSEAQKRNGAQLVIVIILTLLKIFPLINSRLIFCGLFNQIQNNSYQSFQVTISTIVSYKMKNNSQ